MFDVDAAKQSGYSDQEIANFLSSNHPNFDVQGAIKSGYSLSEVANELNNPQAKQEAPSQLGSFARGAMSGIPGAETVVSGIQSLSPDKTYEQAHQELEQAKDKDWEQNPVAYGVGKTAGMVGTGLVAPAGIPAAIGIGAASGLDAAERPADMLADAAKGGVMGGALGVVGEKVISPLLEKLPGVAKAGLASLGKETTPETIENYLANPSAINAAGTKEELAEGFSKSIGKLEDKTSQMSAGARDLLSGETSPLTTPLPKLKPESTGIVNSSGQEIMKDLTKDQTIVPDTLSPIFNDLKGRYLQNGVPKNSAAESAINALDDQYERLVEIAQAQGGKLTEENLKEQIVGLQKLSQRAFVDDATVSESKDALKNLSGALNGVLKDSNPAYGEAMKPVAEQTGMLERLKDKFALTLNPDGKVVPSDQTASRVMNAIKEGKTESYELLNDLKDITGIDYLQKVKDSVTANALNSPGAGEGLRNVMTGVGFGFGHMTHIPFGGVFGAAGGRMLANSLNGGQIAKSIMDKYLSFQGSGMNAALAKYGPILVNAAKAGGNQLASTHFVLATSNPDYQKMIEEHQEQAQ